MRIQVGDKLRREGYSDITILKVDGEMIASVLEDETFIDWCVPEYFEDWKLIEAAFIPEIVQAYYRVDFGREELYFRGNWGDCDFEEKMLERGLIFRTEEEAVTKAKLMLNTK